METFTDKKQASEDLLLLSLQMIADELEDADMACHLAGDQFSTQGFYGLQLYRGQPIADGQLYVLEEAYREKFPVHDVSYISNVEIAGAAPHICSNGTELFTLLNFLMSTFEKYHRFENDINNSIAKGHDLEELCRIGSRFFSNPMYIHDKFFNVIALPTWIQGMLNFTYNEETQKYNIPLSLIDDFKFSDKYHSTLLNRHAGIWDIDQYPFGMRSMYVNLWDEDNYRGRLLINELNTTFKAGQYQVAEFLGRKIVEALRQENQHALYYAKSYEKTMKSLLIENRAHPGDMQVLMTTLGWNEDDTYLCTCLESQNQDLIITTENVFRSALSSIFPNSILFFVERRLFLIIDLAKSTLTASEVHHRLAPLARDSLMYGGMSSPIQGIYNLPYAYQQSSIALDYASRWQNAQWVLDFEKCALAYLYENVDSKLPAEYRIANALLTLHRHDEEKGSDFYHTLKVYLECERNIPKASAALIIHRTTLLYRLEKIQELIRLHLDDPEERLYLLISFQIMEQEMR